MRAVCFTILVDEAIVASGDFDAPEPTDVRMTIERLTDVLEPTGDARAELMEHASKPGCCTALAIDDDNGARVWCAKPGQGDGAPPHPHLWLWETLRRGYRAAQS